LMARTIPATKGIMILKNGMVKNTFMDVKIKIFFLRD